MKLLKVGDLIETPPNEMHALKLGVKVMSLQYLQLVKEVEKIMKMIPLDLLQA